MPDLRHARGNDTNYPQRQTNNNHRTPLQAIQTPSNHTGNPYATAKPHRTTPLVDLTDVVPTTADAHRTPGPRSDDTKRAPTTPMVDLTTAGAPALRSADTVLGQSAKRAPTTPMVDLTTAGAPAPRSESAKRAPATLPPDAAALRTEPLSFAEFYALVQRMLSDRELYQQNERKVFVVPAKMRGSHLYFNIEKNPRYHKKRSTESKYQYVMTSHFGGSDPTMMTVRVADRVLRPHFPLDAGEMRKLNREDRQRSQRLVRDGGLSVKESLTKLAPWQLQMLHTAQDYFDTVRHNNNNSDQTPLVLVLQRNE